MFFGCVLCWPSTQEREILDTHQKQKKISVISEKLFFFGIFGVFFLVFVFFSLFVVLCFFALLMVTNWATLMVTNWATLVPLKNGNVAQLVTIKNCA